MPLERMDDPRVVRVERRDRRVSLLAGALAVGLLVAVLKPWGPATGVPSSTAAPTGGPVVAVPTATLPRPSASPLTFDPAVEWCYSGLAWQLLSIEEDFGRHTRSWRSLDVSLSAAGPTDPSVPATRVFAQKALGLGFCAPFGETDVAFGRVTAWRIDKPGVATPILLETLAGGPSDVDHGGLYRPPPSASVTGSWAAGRYVFEIDWLGPSAPREWFAVDLQIAPGG